MNDSMCPPATAVDNSAQMREFQQTSQQTGNRRPCAKGCVIFVLFFFGALLLVAGVALTALSFAMIFSSARIYTGRIVGPVLGAVGVILLINGAVQHKKIQRAQSILRNGSTVITGSLAPPVVVTDGSVPANAIGFQTGGPYYPAAMMTPPPYSPEGVYPMNSYTMAPQYPGTQEDQNTGQQDAPPSYESVARTTNQEGKVNQGFSQ